MKAYRKALDPTCGCKECGHHISGRVDGEYRCSHCNYHHQAEKVSNLCTCWMGICIEHRQAGVAS